MPFPLSEWPGGTEEMISRHNLTPLFALLCVAVLLPVFGGCSSDSQDQRSREDKTRDEVAKATERAKPVIEKAGRDLDDAAHDAAREARAAAQGAREGWQRHPNAPVDLNSASERDLLSLPGISKA